MTGIQCSNNNFGIAATWLSSTIAYLPGVEQVAGENFVTRSNLGSPDVDSYTSSFTIVSGVTDPIVVTGIPFIPRSMHMNAVIPGSVTLLSQCLLDVTYDLSQVSTSTAVDATGEISTIGTGINLYDGLANLQTSGTIAAWTKDGFVVYVFVSGASNTIVAFTAYP